jgi:hypothetical protein
MSNTLSDTADTRLCGFGWLWLELAAAIQVPMPHFLDSDTQIRPLALTVGA